MTIAIVQCVGVFVAAMYGLGSILNAVCAKDWSQPHVVAFAVGMAMATCGMFF